MAGALSHALWMQTKCSRNLFHLLLVCPPCFFFQKKAFVSRTLQHFAGGLAHKKYTCQWYEQVFLLSSPQNLWIILVAVLESRGLDFGDLAQKKGPKMEKTRKKLDCLQGANPALPQGEGPPRGNSRDFFLTFWFLGLDGKSNERRIKNDKTKKYEIIIMFSRDGFHFFWGGDFGGLILYLGFWWILVFGFNKKETKNGKNKKNRLPTGG